MFGKFLMYVFQNMIYLIDQRYFQRVIMKTLRM